MKLLHTADWHVGKTLRGRSRLDEHERVLNEIVAIAQRESVDLVVIAGDLFETSAPVPEAQKLVWQTLLSLRATGARVAVVAGNHDNPHAFDAMRPVFGAADIWLLGHPRSATNGGVVTFTAADGDPVRVALLPFVSQRFAVKAQQLFELSGADAVKEYNADYRALVAHLCAQEARSAPGPDSVNVLVAHCTIANSLFGGGERTAQSVFEYAVNGNVFPAEAHYVALGHLHRTQRIGAPCPAWYSGSPIQVDFGESDNAPKVLLVEAHPSTPARVTEIVVTSAAQLLTIEGTLEQLQQRAATVGDAWLRVRVHESVRAGLADAVRVIFPNAVDVAVVHDEDNTGATEPSRTRAGRGATELFEEFCESRNVADPRVLTYFNALLDGANSAAATSVSQQVAS